MVNDIRGEVHNTYNHPEQFIHPAEAVRTGRQYVRPTVGIRSITTREPLISSNSKIIATPKNATSVTPKQWTVTQDAAISKALNITPEKVTSSAKELWKTVPTKYSIKSRSFPAKDIAPEGQTPSMLGPRNWLSSWTGKSGKEVTLSESELSQLFNTTKEDVRKYIFGDEFKQRVMNTGQFIENEYKDLTKVLNERLNQTKFGGLSDKEGAINTYYSFPSKEIDLSKGFEVKAYPTYSMTQHRANMWHELWHSLGGTRRTDPDPLIQRLVKYNNEINPTKKSEALQYVKDMIDLPGASTRKESIVKFLKSNNPSMSDDDLVRFAEDELDRYDFLKKEVLQKNYEVRSRMQATLDRLRELGYDTRELIANPDKFREWINELKRNRVNMSWDLQHLLSIYDIQDLANYASKMLSTTGELYLENKYLLNNNNLSSKQNMY